MAADRSGSAGRIIERNQRKYFRGQLEAQQTLDTRVSNLETSEKHLIRMVTSAALYLDGVTLTSGVPYTPPVSPVSALGIENIQGIFANFWMDVKASDRTIFFGSSDDTLTIASQQYVWKGGSDTNRQLMSQLMMIPVGLDGNIKIQSNGGNSTGYMTIIGYWL